MKNLEYLYLMVSALLGDEDLSIFYVLDSYINYLTKCRTNLKRNLRDKLNIIRNKIVQIKNDLYGSDVDINYYQFRTLDDFFNFIKSNCTKSGINIEKMYYEVDTELYSILSEYCSIFPGSANGNTIAEWIELAPAEAYHPFC